LAWLARLIFDLLLVPVYRLYVRVSKKITAGNTAGSNAVSHLFKGRFNIHIFIGLIAVILLVSNISSNQDVASSDALVGKTKLSVLVAEGGVENEQLIEDYPNLDIAKLQRNFQPGLDIKHVEPSIFTNEQAQAVVTPIARNETEIYTVQVGDTISAIAHRFGVTINTVLWENNLTATSLIKPGAQLTILPNSGVSHTIARGQTLSEIAKLYGVSSDDILKANNISNPDELHVGEKIIIPGGTRLAVAPIATAIRQIASSIENIVKSRQPSAFVPAGGRMVWPTVGHTITQYFSWAHTGVDIANHIGTPIYAADSGVVVTVGYNRGGYGNQIIIDHGNGKKTRYGHLSAFDVTIGEHVTKGQYIAAMGSTGHSTGPHLHFEVIINGQVYNPLNYIR